MWAGVAMLQGRDVEEPVAWCGMFSAAGSAGTEKGWAMVQVKTQHSTNWLVTTMLLGVLAGCDPEGQTNTSSSTGFGKPMRYVPSSELTGIAVADINGDGAPDLAVGNGEGIHILRNDGTGAFTADGMYVTTGSVYALVTTDLNQDGKTDVAVTGYGPTHVESLLNGGSGTFANVPYVPTGAIPWGITPADFNGDGKIDLAVGNYGDNTASILLGNDDGTFQPKIDYATATGPLAIVAADLNGDMSTDLVTANREGDSLSVLMNNGNGTFAPNLDYPLGSTAMDYVPLSVGAADLNGDDTADLVVVNGATDRVSIFMNNGDGTFASRVDYLVGDGPYTFGIADFDENGRPDLVVGNVLEMKMCVLYNDGAGAFVKKNCYPLTTSPSSLVVADMNADGHSDIVLPGLTVYLGNGKGNLNPVTQTVPCRFTAVADMNGDSVLDIVGAYDYRVCVALGKGDGTYAERIDFGLRASSFEPTLPAIVVDLNHDGRSDMVTVNELNNRLIVMMNTCVP